MINLPNWLIPYWGRTVPLLPRYTWRSCFSLHNLHPEKLIFFFNIMLFLKTLTWLFQKRRQQGRRWGALHRESWYWWYGERERYLDIKSCVWLPFSGVCFQNDNDHLPGCGDDVSECCSYFLPSEVNGALVNDGRDVNGRAEPLFNRSNRVISLFSGSTRTVPTLAMLTTNFINDPLISRPTFVHTSSLSFKWRLHQNILKYILGLIFIDPQWKA